ncbi:MAG: hypothetical protein GYB33_16055 [Gammaproteobacteria bacterium]|uniref:hypothetical protein n=1 Tax=Pseudomaricurvus alcaniphilus TaxID=1166482 RepID=UPI00140DA086|nr:hypothetical protein [Pseudomaricurvus alcaniphilus]MBR9911858.1 hypothetical protein [Gammaproteobacteria bacterium]NHN39287.1 hypothetical protein [Pseudomaricurvus alcaniphilus]
MASTLFYAAAPAALDNNALWLPAKYQKLQPKLRQAALKLEATDRCDRLLRGSLHESSQGLDGAVFLLVCRDTEFKTYAVLADANTLEFAYVKYGQSMAGLASGDSDPLLEERLQQLRLECDKLFDRKTRFMKNLQRFDDGQPQMTRGEEQELSLFINFDAESMQGNLLNYQATCTSTQVDSPISFTIRARKSALR